MAAIVKNILLPPTASSQRVEKRLNVHAMRRSVYCGIVSYEFYHKYRLGFGIGFGIGIMEEQGAYFWKTPG